MAAELKIPTQDVNGKSYVTDAKGALIPLEAVKPQHLIEDELVRDMMAHAVALSDQISRFKGHCFADVESHQSLLAQEYGGRAGGAKGNVTFMSFDGLLKVQLANADQITFGPELQTAKALLDECFVEWGADSRPEIAAIVNRVFNVDKEGQINKAELFSLKRIDIQDTRWKDAMQAIADSVRVAGSKSYIRFYRRDKPTAPWEAVTLDMASA